MADMQTDSHPFILIKRDSASVEKDVINIKHIHESILEEIS